MTTHTVEIAAAADQAAAIDALTLAFATDPATRWTWPEAKTYLAAFPRFARAFGGAAFVHGSAHRVDGFAGVALWLPPDVHPDEAAIGELMVSTVKESARNDAGRLMEQMVSYHPKEPHWYLPLIGVDPARQGKGLGGALMRHATEICDREGRLAYLESSNPKNIPLYERHGFEILGRIQSGESPVITPMLRQPQRRT